MPGEAPTFYRHEEYSARDSEIFMKRLRFPNALIDEVAHLVRCHMFSYDDSWSDAAVRRFLARVGPGRSTGSSRSGSPTARESSAAPWTGWSLDTLRERIAAVLAAREALGVGDLAIRGGDLARSGSPPGP